MQQLTKREAQAIADMVILMKYSTAKEFFLAEVPDWKIH